MLLWHDQKSLIATEQLARDVVLLPHVRNTSEAFAWVQMMINATIRNSRFIMVFVKKVSMQRYNNIVMI